LKTKEEDVQNPVVTSMVLPLRPHKRVATYLFSTLNIVHSLRYRQMGKGIYNRQSTASNMASNAPRGAEPQMVYSENPMLEPTSTSAAAALQVDTKNNEIKGLK
jgi:hypothetical protein